MSYPPQPWDLRGELYAAAFLVPVRDLPDGTVTALPRGHRLVRAGNRAVVGLAWVDYSPGGVLAYRELMVTVLVRRGRRVLPSIIRIWVDSPESLEGGRALWSIPKELAAITHDGPAFSAPGLALGLVGIGTRSPGRWPVRFAIAQADLHGTDTAVVSPVRVRTALARARMRLEPAVGGPLEFLRGHRAVAAFAMPDFRMSFGHDS